MDSARPAPTSVTGTSHQTAKQEYKALKDRYRCVKRENELLAAECDAAATKLNRLKLGKNIMVDAAKAELDSLRSED
ncbi:hypothetical protein HDU86_000656 [Geranomyces michiganensis]|nr:hypothetical protein HDU86_000656 [Geranomyces michiganensis]